MRYLPHTPAQRKDMLKRIGVGSIDDLFKDVPAEVYNKAPIHLPDHADELSVEQTISNLASKNKPTSAMISFLGAGAYRHHVPASVDYLIQRGEFLTSYTPYQPEMSQGTLQYLFEFQTQVKLITGMEVSNASLYDGSTATLEAILMAMRVTKRQSAVISPSLHPQYREVLETHAKMTGLSVIDGEDPQDDCACVVVQYPDFYGEIKDFTETSKRCAEKGSLLIVVVNEIVALGLLKSPGSMGADIVAGEGKSLGNNLNFGGPYLGLLATREKYLRFMPGRLVGETVDKNGHRGFVLTLAAREQHIRRDKATSNICTNAGLCALAFSIHLSLLGDRGFKRLAKLNHARAIQLKIALDKLPGFEVLNKTFFNELCVKTPLPAAELCERLIAKGILLGVPLSRFQPEETHKILMCTTEMTTPGDIEALIKSL